MAQLPQRSKVRSHNPVLNLNSSSTPYSHKDLDPISHPHLEWVHDNLSADQIALSLRNFSSVVGLGACCNVSDEDIPRVVAEFEHFDFKVLGGGMWDAGYFLAWLYRLVRSPIIQKV